MNNESTDQILDEQDCPACESQASLIAIVRPYDIYLPDALRITAPNISQEICKHCGAIYLSSEASVAVDKFVAEQNDQLSPLEIEEIRNQFGLSQIEMSRALGVGDTVYGQWERGAQIPSRAMGYHLRTLKKFPEVFDYISTRAWK